MYLRQGIRLALIGATTFSAAAAYTLWVRNSELKGTNQRLEAQVEIVSTARKRDAVATVYRERKLQAENDRLIEQLDDLTEITDDEGTNYLNAPVPDTVRQLFAD